MSRVQLSSRSRAARRTPGPRLVVHRPAVAFVAALAAAATIGAGILSASSFTITGASTTAQTLGTGSGQTGLVTDTGTLTVGGSTVAVTISGTNAMLTNLGSIIQSGTGRVIRDNTGVSGLVITNGSATNSTALMQSADADVIQMNKTPASVTLNNYGQMISLNASAGGAQVVDFNAILSGANIVNNFSTGVMQATEADAVRPGVNGVVNNDGLIKAVTTTGSSSDGIDAQTNSGVSIVNAAGLGPGTGPSLIEGGRHGITGGNTDITVNGGAYTMSVLNNIGGTIQGDDGSGINIDGINGNELVTIVNHGTITGNGVSGDGDGVDVDGLVNLTNTGTIKSLNAHNDTSEGVTVGGGTIDNSGTIEGSISSPVGNTGTGRGITIAGVDKDASDNPIPVQAPYGPTTIVNSGLIRGDSDAAIAFTSLLASGFSNTITNMATGILEGGGTAVAVQTGADDDTIINAGVIKADTSGKAIDMGGGNNTLEITGGSAKVIGDISGGVGGTNTMTIDPGAGQTFAYDGSISNFDTVEVDSGLVILSGKNAYAGTTVVDGGILQLGIDDSISFDSDLDLAGGTFELGGFDQGAAGVTGIGDLFLSATSTLDFGGSGVIEFAGLGTKAAGSVLDIADYGDGLDHLYFTGSASAFTSLYGMSDVCFNGGGCGYTIDGYDGYYEVAPIPEPATLGLLAVGLAGVVGRVVKRRR